MCTLLQRKRTQIIDKPLSSFMRPGVYVGPHEIERELQKEGIWRGVLSLIRSDGKLVHLEWYSSAHCFPGVRLAIVTDITERVRLESERNELLASERAARGEAERANRLKDEFLSTLSHELRTPLNSILLWSQALSQQVPDREQLARGLAAIVRNTKVQSQLISDLLDVSRIMSGKLRLDVQPLDLASTIKSALESLLPAIEGKALILQTFLDQWAGIITGDPARLQQVVWNLVNNAIKFTPKGGRIDVKLERVSSHIEIRISDTGQGITPELIPHLFERFRQGDISSNASSGGLGLGLAIVKHLVEMHGGTVVASSEGAGKGATFTVVLPIAASLEDSPPAQANRSGEHMGEMARLEDVRVLIVDDDAEAGVVISRILIDAGAQVATASDFASALTELELFKPQVLVSDIGMPGRDGYDLIREVRARGYTYQSLPAIALTALARPEDRRRALLAGYQVHAAKPIDVGELTALISTLSGRTGAPSQRIT